MAERFTFDPERCFVDLNLSPDPEWELDTLIGRTEHTRILLGSLPYLDSDDHPCSFQPFATGTEIFAPSRSFLFSGGAGCGKRSLVLALAFHLFDHFGKENFRYYAVPLKKYCSGTKVEKQQHLEIVLSGLRMLQTQSENPDGCFYFSLGDLRMFVRKKRMAAYLAEWLEEVLSDPEHMCIVTGWYHGEASDVPECLQRAFSVLHLDPPNKEQRKLFFTQMMRKYPLMIWEMQEEELSEKTDGFSFRMLRKVSDYFCAWAMTAIQQENCLPEDFINGKAMRSFPIPASVCSFVLNNVRAELQGVPIKIPANDSTPLHQSQSPSAESPQPQKPVQEKEPINSVVMSLDRPSAVRAAAKSMRPSYQLQVNATDHNSNAQTQGKKK